MLLKHLQGFFHRGWPAGRAARGILFGTASLLRIRKIIWRSDNMSVQILVQLHTNKSHHSINNSINQSITNIESLCTVCSSVLLCPKTEYWCIYGRWLVHIRRPSRGVRLVYSTWFLLLQWLQCQMRRGSLLLLYLVPVVAAAAVPDEARVAGLCVGDGRLVALLHNNKTPAQSCFVLHKAFPPLKKTCALLCS